MIYARTRVAALVTVGLMGLWTPVVLAQPLNLSAEERAWIHDHPIVRVAVDRNWMPIEYLEQGQIMGLSSDFLAIIERRTGLRVQPVPASTSDEVAGLFARGEVDMVSSLVRGFAPQSVAQQIRETRTYYIGNTFIFAPRDSSMVFDVTQLAGRVVAIKGGGEYASRIRALYPAITVLETRTPEDSLLAVIEGRADVAMGVGQTLLPHLRRKYDGLLQVSGGIAGLSVELTMGVRRDLPMLHGIVDKVLGSISAERAIEIEERNFDYAAYGAPTLRVMLNYYGPIILLGLVSLVLVIAFALHARKERRLAIRSEKEKEMFIAVLSHEIRTPMNAIIASIELLGRGGELSEESRRLLGLARNGSENLLYLLNDVLDVSKLDAGRLQLNPVPTDVTVLVGSIVDFLAVKANEQALSLKLVLPSPIDELLMLDKVRLEQILQNLISNAIKFTAVGGVEVSLALAADAASSTRRHLCIQVRDSGIGIDRHSLEKLFAPYVQASEHTARRYGGTGLGLLISRQLCELMGGSIELDSEPGRGTLVTVVLPCDLCASPSPAALDAEPDPAAIQVRPVEQALRVLLVEDTPANQIVLQAQLEVLGCRSTLCETGSEALQALDHGRFDIVLLDCHLPDLSGYEVARRWRQTEATLGTEPTPIVAVSALSDAEHTIACFDAGMNGVLSKPIRLGKLRDTLQLWANMPVVEVTQDPQSIGDLEAATESVLVDAEALATAVEQGDQEAAQYRAHRLLGACAVLGYSTLIVSLKAIQAQVQHGHYVEARADVAQFKQLLVDKIAP